MAVVRMGSGIIQVGEDRLAWIVMADKTSLGGRSIDEEIIGEGRHRYASDQREHGLLSCSIYCVARLVLVLLTVTLSQGESSYIMSVEI
jgi:hypothetical protein